MSPLEIGGAIGAAFITAGTIVAMLYKGRRNTDDELIKEQIRVLQEIRDNLLKLNYEVSNRLNIQNDKLVSLTNSIASLHERLNGRHDRT